MDEFTIGSDMNWKPNAQESKYLGVISNLTHDAQLGLFTDRITFGENIRALLKALDELPGSVPDENKNADTTDR